MNDFYFLSLKPKWEWKSKLNLEGQTFGTGEINEETSLLDKNCVHLKTQKTHVFILSALIT